MCTGAGARSFDSEIGSGCEISSFLLLEPDSKTQGKTRHGGTGTGIRPSDRTLLDVSGLSCYLLSVSITVLLYIINEIVVMSKVRICLLERGDPFFITPTPLEIIYCLPPGQLVSLLGSHPPEYQTS